MSAPTGPAALARSLPAGRYRWEVSDPATGAQSSLRFHVGWWVEAELPNVPDKLAATLDKTSYRAGETAKLFVKAPFAGAGRIGDRLGPDPVAALARSAGRRDDGRDPGRRRLGQRRLCARQRLSADRRPRSATARPRPGGRRRLACDRREPAHPDADARRDPKSRGRATPVEIPVKVAGLAAGEEAYVTLAAVDEAVLKLTEFDSPAPEKYYFGKRRLGVELRDLYGRLIDPRANAVGVLRSGGDSFAKRSVAGLPDKSSKVVALFSGIVRLDATAPRGSASTSPISRGGCG